MFILYPNLFLSSKGSAYHVTVCAVGVILHHVAGLETSQGNQRNWHVVKPLEPVLVQGTWALLCGINGWVME